MDLSELRTHAGTDGGSRPMRVTLDWDTEEERAANYDAVRDRPQLQDESNPWQLRQSSGGTGYHYVEWNAVTAWNAVVEMREEYGDDSKRLRLDKMRQSIGSPFLQVLYDTKYMDRWGWQPETGNQSDVLDGSMLVPDRERIKRENGTLDYNRIASLLAGDVYGTHAALADSLDMARSTVSGWIGGSHDPSGAAKKKLKRRARHHEIGHYHDDNSMDAAGIEVQYLDTDEKDRRRTIVEYADAPWDWDIGGDDREYALLNVHTGSYNPNHSEEQLKAVHDDVMNHVLERLSPSNPETGEELSLDRETMHPPGREEDSVNYEDALLDRDETRYYLANTVGKTNAANKGYTPADLSSQILFEVILWDGTMTGMEWQLIGVWDGETVSDATIVGGDDNGWW